jgi:catecholate siderophore receptor
MAKYSVGAHLMLQLNVSNLTDKNYFDQLHPFHVVPGPGRTALLSLQMRY